MLQSGDSAVAMRMREELSEQIEKETAALIKAPTEMRAGRIQGFEEALRMLGVVQDKINNPERLRG